MKVCKKLEQLSIKTQQPIGKIILRAISDIKPGAYLFNLKDDELLNILESYEKGLENGCVF
jgi:hypothetical protein